MTTINIQPKALSEALKGEAARAKRALKPAAMAAARRYAKHLADLTDEMEVSDTGAFKAAWKAVSVRGGAQVVNSAPYAAVIELGARPHPVSPEGREHIAQWAQRKLGLSPEAAKAASWGIANKIRMQGQKPTYMVRDSLPVARRFFAEEFIGAMRRMPRSAK